MTSSQRSLSAAKMCCSMKISFTIFSCWSTRTFCLNSKMTLLVKRTNYTNVRVEPVIPAELENEEDTPAVGVIQPGASYEENFMRQVETVSTKRQRNPPKRFSPDECNVAASSTASDDEPKSVTDALNSKNSRKWMQALEAEYNSLVKSETWELVSPPDDA